MDLCVVLLEDGYPRVLGDEGYDNRLNNLMSVVHCRPSSTKDMELCTRVERDPGPNHYTACRLLIYQPPRYSTGRYTHKHVTISPAEDIPRHIYKKDRVPLSSGPSTLLSTALQSVSSVHVHQFRSNERSYSMESIFMQTSFNI